MQRIVKSFFFIKTVVLTELFCDILNQYELKVRLTDVPRCVSKIRMIILNIYFKFINKQERQFTYNATLRHVIVTIVEMEKQ